MALDSSLALVEDASAIRLLGGWILDAAGCPCLQPSSEHGPAHAWQEIGRVSRPLGCALRGESCETGTQFFCMSSEGLAGGSAAVPTQAGLADARRCAGRRALRYQRRFLRLVATRGPMAKF